MRTWAQAGGRRVCLLRPSEPPSLCHQGTDQVDSGQVSESKHPIQPCSPGRGHPRRRFLTFSELHVLFCSYTGQSGSILTREGASVASWAILYPLQEDTKVLL